MKQYNIKTEDLLTPLSGMIYAILRKHLIEEEKASQITKEIMSIFEKEKEKNE